MTGTDLCVNKPNQSRSYLNHLVYTSNLNIHNFYVLHTQCIYVFYVDFRINSDYFTVQH